MDLATACAEVAAVDVAGCDRAGLDLVLGMVGRIEAWLATVTAAVVARTAELHAVGLALAPELALQRAGGKSKREAHDVVARRAAIDAAPALGAALAAGRVAPAHVDTFARVSRHAPQLAQHDELLAGVAEKVTPEAFAEHCRRLALLTADDGGLGEFERQRRATRLRRWVDEASGMYRITGEFDPETGSKVWTALDRQIEALFHDRHPDTAPTDPRDRADHLAALALADLVVHQDAAGPGAGSSTGTRRAEVVVHVDLPTLLDGLHDRSVIDLAAGGSLPVEVVRRLACDADLIPVVLSGDGVVLDVGRSKRLATPDQRRALRAMYPTCAVDRCTTPFSRTKVHHVDLWTRHRGRTDLDRMLPLCDRHHDDVHAGRLAIAIAPGTRALTARGRDGTVLWTTIGPPGRRPPPARGASP